MRYKAVLIVIIFYFFLNGCSQPAIYTKTKLESTLYEEKSMPIDGQKEISIICDYGNIEFFCWDKQEVKFEMKKRVRGATEKSKLDEKLNDFNINIKEDEKSILFMSEYKGSIKSTDDKMLDLRIYVPKSFKLISLKMEKGYLKLYDDMRCNLNVDASIAHIDINNLIGAIKLNLKTGNVKFNYGKISADSEIKIGTGNIYVKSQYEKNVKCLYETKTGNIELYLPNNFKSGMELYGTIELNELPDVKPDNNFVVRTDIGKITLRRLK